MKHRYVAGERYCGNYLNKKVHDLLNLRGKCQIESLVEAGDDIPFISLEIALKAGYVRCEYCIENMSD